MPHSKYSPSSSEKWLNCPSAIRLTDQLVSEGKIPEEEESSPYAEEGTLAHEYLENAIQALQKEESIPDAPSLEMDKAIESCIEYISEFTEVQSLITEIELPLFYSPDETGTADIVALHGDTLHVFDLKYGKGVPVEAEGNTQLKIYAVCAYDVFSEIINDFEFIIVHIMQPRLNSFTLAEYAPEELDKFRSEVKEKVTLSKDNSIDEYNPSEKTCRWCRANSFCASYQKFTLGDVFSDIDKEEGDIVDIETKINLFKKSKAITRALEANKKDLMELALSGEKLPSLKLVEGRKIRRWYDQEKAIKVLGRKFRKHEYIEEKLLSPAKCEKLISGQSTRFVNKIKGLIDKPKGEPTLVKEEDKRPEYESDNSMFEDMDS